MQRFSAMKASMLVVLGIAALATAGCDDSSEPLLSTVNVAGNWNYQITNGDTATFVNCTGDVAYLEGVTFNAALAIAPICTVGASTNTVQNDDAFEVELHNVNCSDGSTADVIGPGTLTGSTLDGQWNSSSNAGVDAIQDFNGVVNGNTIGLLETRRTFGGTLQGACDLSPALNAVVLIQ